MHIDGLAPLLVPLVSDGFLHASLYLLVSSICNLLLAVISFFLDDAWNAAVSPQICFHLLYIQQLPFFFVLSCLYGFSISCNLLPIVPLLLPLSLPLLLSISLRFPPPSPLSLMVVFFFLSNCNIPPLFFIGTIFWALQLLPSLFCLLNGLPSLWLRSELFRLTTLLY